MELAEQTPLKPKPSLEPVEPDVLVHTPETVDKMRKVAGSIKLISAIHDLGLNLAYVDSEARQEYPGVPITDEMRAIIRGKIKADAIRAEEELLGISRDL